MVHLVDSEMVLQLFRLKGLLASEIGDSQFLGKCSFEIGASSFLGKCSFLTLIPLNFSNSSSSSKAIVAFVKPLASVQER
jgi:hypothetical protein